MAIQYCQARISRSGNSYSSCTLCASSDFDGTLNDMNCDKSM